ncbi:MAG TPA: hypothetical protein VIB82_03805 [Caulobacteraceae bacterium]
MTTISTYSSGYNLASGGLLTITRTGTIGGTGLLAASGSTTVNQGLMEGALYGGSGQSGRITAFFVGPGVSLNNAGTIVGGQGFNGHSPGTPGYNGGGGVALSQGSITNGKSITGGVGGAGGVGGYGKITGGTGGVGGAGGFGANLQTGSMVNNATITGGAGGVGGLGGPGALDGGYGGTGGRGGVGVYFQASTLINRGVIAGGTGGAGGAGGSGALGGGPTGGGGLVGQGISVAGGGSIDNASATARIIGYDGIVHVGAVALTVTNFGTIAGVRDSVLFNTASDRLIAEAGSVFIGEVVGDGGALTLASGTGTITNLGGAAALAGSITASFQGFGSYALTGTASWTLAGSEALASGHAMTVGTGASLKLSNGTLANAGLLAIRGGTSAARLIIAGADSLSGAGSIVLSGAAEIVAAGAGAGLTNAGNVISGGGAIEGSMSLTNTASGVIDASSGALIIDTGATVVNDGLIEATARAQLVVRATTIDSSGGGSVSAIRNIELDGGVIEGGVFTVAAGGILLSGAKGGTVNLGAATLTSGGVVDGTAGGLTINGAVANNHLIEAVKGALTITGAVTGTGSARIVAVGALELDGACAQTIRFTDAGTLTLGDFHQFTGHVGFSAAAGDTVVVKGMAFSAGDMAHYKGTSTGGTLTVMNGAATVLTLAVTGDATKATFTVSGTASQIVITDQATTPSARIAGLLAAAAGFGAPAGSAAGHARTIETGARSLLAGPLA